jgi:hypothetical protein
LDAELVTGGAEISMFLLLLAVTTNIILQTQGWSSCSLAECQRVPHRHITLISPNNAERERSVAAKPGCGLNGKQGLQ